MFKRSGEAEYSVVANSIAQALSKKSVKSAAGEDGVKKDSRDCKAAHNSADAWRKQGTLAISIPKQFCMDSSYRRDEGHQVDFADAPAEMVRHKGLFARLVFLVHG
jgi:hypothetical protein